MKLTCFLVPLKYILSNMKALILTLLIFLPQALNAHGIGEVYALPIPLHYYVTNTALAVALSFLILGFFMNKKNLNTLPDRRVSFRGLSLVILVLKYVTLLLFIIVVVAGLINKSYLYAHFTPIFFWVYFLIGVSILSVLFGNIWEKINPWRTVTNWFKIGNGAIKHTPPWIAPLLLFSFIWFELVASNSFDPQYISAVIIVYLGVTIIGANTYKDWHTKGDMFGAMFSTFGILSHFKISEDNEEIVVINEDRKLSGIVPHISLLAITWFLLSGATFDSIKETVHWYNLFVSSGLETTYSNLQIFDTVGLLLTPLFFTATYLAAIWIMKRITRHNDTVLTLSLKFVYSLIPIAFGYILAHNFTLFIVSGPQMLSLISDPFNLGWNVFGTAGLIQNELILGAKFVWFVEIGFILLAHIFGVWYAHVLALNIFSDPKIAFKSQYPLVILMVFYTALTLWLISQPLVVTQ